MSNQIAEGEDYKKELTSDFNEAKFQIYRLHILWITCNTISNSGELTKWKWKLDTIWRELSPDATLKDEGKDKKDTYAFKVKELNDSIAKAKDNTATYNTLQEKEIFLRCLQDAVGKGSKKSSTDMEDFDE